jgi:hypothetical protein
MVLTEAFAAATPVVCSDIAGYRDVLRDGVDGMLVPVGDAAALGEALLGLVAGFAVVLGGLVPPRRPRRTPIERLNDAAFAVVLSAVSLLLAITARPWTAALPGLVGGVLGGLFLRRAPGGGAAPPAAGPPTP